MNGVNTFLTSEVTTLLNAAPMMNAIARSTTLPRRIKSRNPLSIVFSPLSLVVRRLCCQAVQPGLHAIVHAPRDLLEAIRERAVAWLRQGTREQGKEGSLSGF